MMIVNTIYINGSKKQLLTLKNDSYELQEIEKIIKRTFKGEIKTVDYFEVADEEGMLFGIPSSEVIKVQL